MSNRSKIFKRYRLIPLIAVGLLTMTLLCALGLLIWGIVAYFAQMNIAEQNLTPALVYLVSLFVACGFMTLLVRGGTVFPSLIVATIATVITFFLAEPETLTFLGCVLKIVLSLVISTLAFSLVKGCFIMNPARRRQITAATPKIKSVGKPSFSRKKAQKQAAIDKAFPVKDAKDPDYTDFDEKPTRISSYDLERRLNEIEQHAAQKRAEVYEDGQSQ